MRNIKRIPHVGNHRSTPLSIHGPLQSRCSFGTTPRISHPRKQINSNSRPSHKTIASSIILHFENTVSQSSTIAPFARRKSTTFEANPRTHSQKILKSLNMFPKKSFGGLNTTRRLVNTTLPSRHFSVLSSLCLSPSLKSGFDSKRSFCQIQESSKLTSFGTEPIPIPKEMDEFAKGDRQKEKLLRRLFATNRDHKSLAEPHLSLINVYDNVDRFSRMPVEENLPVYLNHYMDPNLSGSSIAPSFNSFLTNWNSFSVNAFPKDLDWSNIIVAGGSVSAAMMPRPSDFILNQIKDVSGDYRKKLSRYYTEKAAFAGSDLDLFIYGLSPLEAEKKVAYLHGMFSAAWRQSLLTIRTQNAITFVPDWPKRKIQIILRLYKSPAEVLVGFDVDCCAVAFDGANVWASPRALRAFNKRYNLVDLERQSKTYEIRLFKYAKRGFGVAIPGLKDDMIDYDKVCSTQLSNLTGLGKLLHLQELDKYDKKATLNEYFIKKDKPFISNQNIYEAKEYEVDEGKSLSDYESIFIPYGPSWNRTRIVSLFEQRRNSQIARKILDPKVEKPFVYKPPYIYSCFIDDILGNYKPDEYEDRPPEKIGLWQKFTNYFRTNPKGKNVYDAFRIVSSLPKKVFWREVDPGSQLIGSFHPLRENWFKDALKETAHQKLVENGYQLGSPGGE